VGRRAESGQNRRVAVRASRARRARGCAAAVLSCAAVLLPADAAAARGLAQQVSDAAFYRTELSAVEPTPAGVTVRVDPGGEWIEMTATGPSEIIVLGYTGEPFLRIAAGVVEENQLSPTTFLNRRQFADSIPTGQGNAAAVPIWTQIASTGTARWYDHRIHWMGQGRPPPVNADPRHPHPVGTWAVDATAAGFPFEIRGTLRWLGKPASADGVQWIPGWAWLVEALTVTIGGLCLALIAKRWRPEVGQTTVRERPAPR
jgi:hypothetical protein